MGRVTKAIVDRKPEPTPAPPPPRSSIRPPRAPESAKPSSSAAGLKIRRVKISSLHADPANANRHPERSLEAIGASIKTFGQVEPLIVQKSSGRVIGGNGRLEYFKLAGIEEVDIVELEISDERAAALGIALNRTPEFSHRDEDAIARILEALPPDLQSAAGFNAEELDEAIAAGFSCVSEVAPPELPSGERSPFRQMAFIVSDEQAKVIEAALAAAKAEGPFIDTGNENTNGNALARIAEAYGG